jgi:hypothetical protein
MGHHHRRNRNQERPENEIPQNTNNNPLGNMDISSMLGNLNLDNVDLSKIDMSKVQSMMDKITIPKGSSESPSGSPNNGNDARINILNSLKAIMPARRARSMDSLSKFIQLAQLINPNRGNNPRVSKHK